jgi:AmmeMemoRadiSam system protein B/AmmeMemoRadiSam system protein A
MRKIKIPGYLFWICLIIFAGACGKKDTKTDPNKSSAQTQPGPTTEKTTPEEPPKSILKSKLAGLWYPADEQTLKQQIETLSQGSKTEPLKNVIALIMPHAGYQYSGQTAVSALKTLDRPFKRIIVIGPSHSLPMQQILSVPKVTHYQTPLGTVALDVEFINQLLKHPMFKSLPQAHENEHSVQIQLPLLQYTQKDFKFVPIVAGHCSPEIIEKAADIIRHLIDENTLVIVSSDFTHYGQTYGYVPFTDNVPEKLKELDMGAYKYIADLDSKGFLEYHQKTQTTICGFVPIAILLDMLPKDTKTNLIQYTTSGELTGDYKMSVSYLAIAFSGNWQKGPDVELKSINNKLSDEDKKQLLALARKTISYLLEKSKVPSPSDLGITVSEPMKQNRAAFVTLTKNSQLRGCIGDILPVQPLFQSVISNAVNASVRDRRFLPVRISEVNDIKIEISALTVPEPVSSPTDIRIGTDGVILQKNGRQAVFLPQVAPEQGWNLEQMLSQLSLKAGLNKDDWKKDAAFLVFQAEVFGEEK